MDLTSGTALGLAEGLADGLAAEGTAALAEVFADVWGAGLTAVLPRPDVEGFATVLMVFGAAVLATALAGEAGAALAEDRDAFFACDASAVLTGVLPAWGRRVTGADLLAALAATGLTTAVVFAPRAASPFLTGVLAETLAGALAALGDFERDGLALAATA